MATQEFYIRNETDTEARGPFTIEQLSSLVDSSQVTPATLFYDPTSEQWTAIDQDTALKDSLFPEKRKLSVRTVHNSDTLNKERGTSAPILVNDLLAAAEGRTADSKSKKDPGAGMARAAGMGRWAAIIALVMAAAGELLPSASIILELKPATILTNPMIILGAVDLFVAVLLGLGVVSLYPLVRFRAALGLGFFGFIFFAHGQTDLLLALVGGSIGLYCCTFFVNYFPVIVSAVMGIAGFAFVFWKLLTV